MKTVRIASGQGFWGDWREAPVNQVRKGAIDYLVMDYLAELTMSVLTLQKERDSKLGYAHDFVHLCENILEDVVSKNIKVIANAGGVNPKECALAIFEAAKNKKLSDKVKIVYITGDDVSTLLNTSPELSNLDTQEPLSTIKNKIVSANAYIGAQTVVEALKKGANIIVTGRVADPSLFLAPLVHEFNWSFDDYDRLSLGTVAGHIAECGAQSSGGNCLADWQSIPDMAHIGLPIIEAKDDGSVDITKHPGTGGLINLATVKEQLVYEIGDPKNYITPDVIADFTSIKLEQIEKDRVRVSGVKGKPPTDSFKVSICYKNGFKAEGTLVFAWPDAAKKAKASGEIIKTHLADKNLKFDDIRVEVIGQNACHGDLASKENEPEEVTFRMAVRSQDKEAVNQFTQEIAPLVVTGPPGVAGYTGGKPKVHPVFSFWPTLMAKSLVEPNIKVEFVS